MSVDEPDEFERLMLDVTFTIITCADCGSRDHIDPLTICLTTTTPCGCGCDGWLILCQVCGDPIGWGSMGGTIDLDN